MMKAAVVILAWLSNTLAFACPSSQECDESHEVAVQQEADPAHCARKAELMRNSCSYTTNMMAQRVLEEGAPYTYTGRLSETENELDSRVAAPFAVGPEQQIHIVANEIVERLAGSASGEQRLTLEGRLLEVDGVSYFVATTFSPAST